jgi:arylformamidase
LLAFIHGGYWQNLDKGDFSYLAPPFVETGIAFASLNYDLAPKVGIAEIVAQIRGAVLWLAHHAGDHGIDAGRIFLAGHSAGGHLAVMAMTAEGPAPNGRLVRGACSISGVYELEPVRRSYHQDILRLDAATVRTMSPLRQVPKRAGPLILAVGGDETPEFLHQQEDLVAAWRAGGLAVQVVDLPGRHHFSAVDALADRNHPLFAAVCAMIRGG